MKMVLFLLECVWATVLVIRMRMTRMQSRKRGCLATMREARFGTLVNRCVQQDDDDYVCRQPHQPVPIHPLPRSDSASSPSTWMEPTSSSLSSQGSLLPVTARLFYYLSPALTAPHPRPPLLLHCRHCLGQRGQ